MPATAVKKEAMSLIEQMSDSKLRLVVRYARSLNSADEREEKRRDTLLSLAGSVRDESFVRPADRPPEQRKRL